MTHTTQYREPTPQELADGYREFVGEDGEGVDLWHFAMMNDSVRNSAYEAALRTSLRKGGVVLDIGTGSGLLAMMAIRHGASRVITCEAVPVIARKAKEIIKRNGYEGRIQVINKKSTDLVVGRDLDVRADVLVTEIFDDGLLGEHALGSIQHAKHELLKPGAQIIPYGVRVLATVIESREIFENHRVSQAAGFDLSAFNEFSERGYFGYHLDKMNYRVLCPPKAVFEFDFHNAPADETVPFELTVSEGGLCHAIVYWYQLKLDPETTISTAAGLAKLSSWKQAVQLLEVPRHMAAGERVKLVAHHSLEALWFTI